MRRLIVTLDDELDLWLKGQPNQAEIVRKALHLYHGDITTDTVQGLRIAFQKIMDKLEEIKTNRTEPRVEKGDWGA